MNEVVADTNAIYWYLYDPGRLTKPALDAMNLAASSTIYLSSITLVEIIYLVEKGRFASVVLDDLVGLVDDVSLPMVLVPLTLKVAQSVRSVPRSLVPDMPDRIIAATAVSLGLPLVTADSQIRSSGVATIW